MNGSTALDRLMQLRKERLQFLNERKMTPNIDVIGCHKEDSKENKCTQTTYDLVTVIKKLVHQRFLQYRDAFIREERSEKNLDPFIINLRRENEELRQQATLLQAKLEQLEKKKRRVEVTISSHQVESSPVSTASQSLDNLPPHERDDVSRATFPRYIHSNTTTTSSHGFHQQPLPMKYGAAVQRVSPVLQPLQYRTHPYPLRERFLYFDGNQGRSGSNNMKMTSSNQKAHMSYLPPDLKRMAPLKPHGSVVMNALPVDSQRRQTISDQNLHGNMIWKQKQFCEYQLPSYEESEAMKRLFTPMELVKENGPNICQSYSALPKLKAGISTNGNSGIVLTWDYECTPQHMDTYKVECYQLFAHQAKNAQVNPPPDIKQWKKIGVVNALPLPMACTLTQFASGNVYFFAVLAVDVHGREGELSNSCLIRMNLNS